MVAEYLSSEQNHKDFFQFYKSAKRRFIHLLQIKTITAYDRKRLIKKELLKKNQMEL